MESPSTSPEALLWGWGLVSIGMPFLQTPGANFRVHGEGDRVCSLRFAAWPEMESSSVCFFLHSLLSMFLTHITSIIHRDILHPGSPTANLGE